MKIEKNIRRKVERLLARKAFEYVCHGDLKAKKAFIYRVNEWSGMNYTEKDFKD